MNDIIITFIIVILTGIFTYKFAKYNYNKVINKFKKSNYSIAEFSDNLGKKGFIILKDNEKLSKYFNETRKFSKIYHLEFIIEAMDLFKTKQEAEIHLNKLKINLDLEVYKEQINPIKNR